MLTCAGGGEHGIVQCAAPVALRILQTCRSDGTGTMDKVKVAVRVRPFNRRGRWSRIDGVAIINRYVVVDVDTDSHGPDNNVVSVGGGCGGTLPIIQCSLISGSTNDTIEMATAVLRCPECSS